MEINDIMKRKNVYEVLVNYKIPKQNQVEYLFHTNKMRQEINSEYNKN